MEPNRNCRECGKPVVFVQSAVGRSIIVLDPEPAANGNIVLKDGEAHYIKKDDLFEPRPEGEVRYVSHFATCTNPKRFRKRRV